MKYIEKEFDFFISHASEDKDTFVRPLANELIKMGFKVWFDEITLKLGDSLFEEISNGIKKSTFGIVVISNNFLNKEWTKKELNGLISKEIFTNDKVILPVWLEISAKEVFAFSPILADKVSVSVKANEIDKVILQILSTTKSGKVTQKMILEKIEHIRSCNEDERKKYVIDTESRIKNLVHFQTAYYNWFCSDGVFGDEDDWDDFLAEKKRHELQNDYNLPYNITYNPEFGPGKEMADIIRLSKKWISLKATVAEIYELIFLIDWYHELDLAYILWGYSAASLEDIDTHDLCFFGPYTLDPKKNITETQIDKAQLKVFGDYYG